MLNSIKSYKHIIWDWNGTLLDDVNIVIEAMNSLLRRRELPLLDILKYKDIFAFPVKDYYEQLGFDFHVEPFEQLAFEYISEFNSEKHQFKLHDGVLEVLEFIKSIGVGQSILSASKEQELNDAVNKLNISKYFIRVVGLNNHYAASKLERGKELLDDLGLNPKEVLFIGDTIHDYEVAKEIGCDCLIICNGHQNFKRISSCDTNIINTISKVVDFIKGEYIAQPD